MSTTNDCLRCKVYDLADGASQGWDGIEAAINRGIREFSEFAVIDWFFDPMPDDYYGEFSQGHEGDLYIVLKHNGSERFFRKSGRGDSYSNHFWTGEIREVFPKKIERVVYEYSYDETEK